MNELILALDTTHEFGSLAILRGEDLVEEILLHSRDGFGHVLYGHLDQLLARHGVAVREVACFAVTSGPGSFTGVRVGLAAAKGLAEAVGRPLVAVSNLRAMAWFGTRALRAVVFDARRGEVYGGLFDAQGAPLAPETVTHLPAWLAGLPEGDLELLATDFAPFQPALAGTRFAGAALTTVPRALAGAVGHIALDDFRAGRAQDPAAVDANYVRRSDAEVMWREY